MEKEYPMGLKPKIFCLSVGIVSALWPLILKLIAIIRGLDIQPKNSSESMMLYGMYSIFVLGGLWIIAWTLRLRILISPSGLGFRAFDTWTTTWDNIDCMLVTPYGLTVALKRPMQPKHKISNILGSSLGAKSRLTLMFHMNQWKNGLEEDFKRYAPELFKEGGFKSFP